MWKYLFAIVGDPKELFAHCLANNDLRTATSYLIIIQTLEPYAVSSRLQVELLERTLEVEDFALTSEVVRYLTSVGSRLMSEIDAGGSAVSGRRQGYAVGGKSITSSNGSVNDHFPAQFNCDIHGGRADGMAGECQCFIVQSACVLISPLIINTVLH